MENARSLPSTIYKYSKIDEYLLHHLINNQFWFSSVLDFNDPFDCNICFDDHLNKFFDKEVVKYRRPTLTDPYWIGLEERLERGDFHHLNDMENYKIVYRPSNEELISKTKELKENVSSLGICCFSETESNTLMWSHYANSHKGICLGYETAVLVKEFSNIHYIKYDKELPSLSHSTKEQLISSLITQKSDDWKYEKEIRIISKRKGLHSFPRSAIKSIIFGLKTPEAQMKSVLNLLLQTGYKSIETKNVVIINNEYKIQFSEIPY